VTVTVSGERIYTHEGGFNPTWQRHSANYAFAARFLPPGRTLDLGCGTGHAAHYLEDRWSVGIDLDHAALAVQDRPTVRTDLRRLPFAGGSVDSVVCLHAIEHVPDPENVAAEAARVVRPGGTVVFATPNRLTFGRPDEIIDPYHEIEFDPTQFQVVCRPFYAEVTIHGLFGSERYMEFFHRERRKLDRTLALDPLRLRRFVPIRLKRQLYDWRLTKERSHADPLASSIGQEDFFLKDTSLNEALDLFAVCTKAG
jgi:SAM-dependent methyltransferase